MDNNNDISDDKTEIERLTKEVSALKDDNDALAKEREELLDEIDQLNRELENFTSKSSPSADELRYLRGEKAKLEREIEFISKDLDKYKYDLSKERDNNQKLQQQLRDEKSSSADQERELDTYKREARELRKQITVQQQKIESQQQADYKEKLQEKNQQIETYISEISALSSKNKDLQQELEALSEELANAIKEAELGNTDAKERITMITEMRLHIESLEMEKETCLQRVSELESELKVKDEIQEKLLFEMDTKIQQWQRALEERDMILAEKDKAIKVLRDQISLVTTQISQAEPVPDLEKYDETLEGMKRAILQRDHLITSLKQQIAESETDKELIMSELISKEEGSAEEVEFKVRKALRANRLTVSKLKEEKESLEAQLDQQRVAYATQGEALEEAQQEIVQLKDRMDQYEKGYGIQEAVSEYKQERAKVATRDRSLRELGKQLDELENQVTALYNENRILRTRAQVPENELIDLHELKIKDKLELEQLRAMNKQYENEIEELEEERLKLKAALRMQALAEGETAMKLGLSHPDLIALENYADNLRQKKFTEIPLEDRSSVQLRRDVNNLTEELKKTKKALAISQLECEDLRESSRNAGISEQLLRDLDDLKTFVKDLKLDQKKIPDDIKQAMNRSVTATPTQQWVSITPRRRQEDNTEFQELMAELRSLNSKLSRKGQQVKQLKQQLQVTEEESQQKRKIPLPPEMVESAASHSSYLQELTFLNEQLLLCVEELHYKDNLIQQMETDIASYKTGFGRIKEQMSLFYAEHFSLKSKLEQQIADMKKEVADSKSKYDEMADKSFIADTVLKSMTTEEAKRELILLKVAHSSLTRKYEAIREEDDLIRKDLKRVINEKLEMEKSCLERITDVQQARDAYQASVTTLQQMLQETVPAIEYHNLYRRYNELAEKHKDILEREKDVTTKFVMQQSIVDQARASKAEVDQMKEELDDARAQILHLKSIISSSTPISIQDLRSRVVSLELSEQSAKMKADNLKKQLDTSMTCQKELEERAEMLENTIVKLNQQKHQAMEVENSLRTELQGTVSREDHNALVNRTMKMEESLSAAQAEASKYKELFDMATRQASLIQDQSHKSVKEMEELRNAVRNLQADSDKNLMIGKLHQQLLASQANETSTIRKLEQSQSDMAKYSNLYHKLEKKMDETLDILFKMKEDHRSKLRQMQNRIDELLRADKYLERVEKLVKSLREVELAKLELEKNLTATTQKNHDLLIQVNSLEIKLKEKEDLLKNVKTDANTKKLIELSNQMTDFKVSDMRLKRELSALQAREQYLTKLNTDLEANLKQMEDQLLDREKQHDQKVGMLLEQMKDLERQIADRDKLSDLALLLEQKRNLSASIDPSLPLSKRLSEALKQIEEHEQKAKEQNVQIKDLESRVEDLNRQLEDRKDELMKKDVQLKDMTLQLTHSPNFEIPTRPGENVPFTYTSEYRTLENLYQQAQDEIFQLQQSLSKKDESMIKYQHMLSEARENYLKELMEAKEEIARLTDQQYKESNRYIEKLKALADQQPKVQSEEPGIPVNEMDALLLQKELHIRDLNVDLNNCKKEMLALKQAIQRYEATLQEKDYHIETIQQQSKPVPVDNTALEHMQAMLEKKQIYIQRLEADKQELQAMIRDKEYQITELEMERDTLAAKEKDVAVAQSFSQITSRPSTAKRDSNISSTTRTAPSTPSVSQQTKKYKAQIENKDKQIKALQDAIVLLKQDLVAAYEKAADIASRKNEEAKAEKEYEAEISVLHDKVSSLEESLKKAEEKLKERSSAAFEQLQTEKQKQSALITQLTADLKRQQKESQRLQVKNEKLEAELEALKERENSNPKVAQLEQKVKVLQMKQTPTKPHNSLPSSPLPPSPRTHLKPLEHPKKIS